MSDFRHEITPAERPSAAKTLANYVIIEDSVVVPDGVYLDIINLDGGYCLTHLTAEEAEELATAILYALKISKERWVIRKLRQ